MPKASTEMMEQLRRDLLFASELNLNYLVLTISACIIASLGLLLNSAAVIIGAMIIAPLMLPLRGLALAALEADRELFSQSLKTIGLGTLVSVSIAWLLGSMFGLPASEFGTEIIARTQPTLADLGVAIAAGAISGFAKVRPQVSDALAGTAIAVALMPPICVVGIALSQGDWEASGGAFLLYFTNLLGITLACLFVFIWGGYSLDARKMRRALLWLLSMTGVLVIPLFISLWNLIRQEQLEGLIRTLLENETITVGQQTELIDLDVQWNLTPWSKEGSTIILTVRAKEPVTPKQVGQLEKFLFDKLKQPFKIVFRVREFQEVQAGNSEKHSPKNLTRSIAP